MCTVQAKTLLKKTWQQKTTGKNDHVNKYKKGYQFCWWAISTLLKKKNYDSVKKKVKKLWLCRVDIKKKTHKM